MDQHAKTLFTIAAAFNVIAGLPILFAMPLAAQWMGMRPVPVEPLFIHLCGVLVLTFGWGYWRVACDPVANRPIIHMGILGKSLVVLSVLYDWVAGNTNWPFVVLISGDLVFAALFFDYLRKRPLPAS